MNPRYWLAVVFVFVIIHLVSSTWFVQWEVSRRAQQQATSSPSLKAGGGFLAPGLHPAGRPRAPRPPMPREEAHPLGQSSVEGEFPTSEEEEGDKEDEGEGPSLLSLPEGHYDSPLLPATARSLPAWDNDDDNEEADLLLGGLAKEEDEGDDEDEEDQQEQEEEWEEQEEAWEEEQAEEEEEAMDVSPSPSPIPGPAKPRGPLAPWERQSRPRKSIAPEEMAKQPPQPSPQPDTHNHTRTAWLPLRPSEASEEVIARIRARRIALCDSEDAPGAPGDQTSHCYLTGHPNEMYCYVRHLRMALDGFHTRLLYDNLPAPERYMDVARDTFQMADCAHPHVQARLRQEGVTPRFSSADWVHSVDEPGEALACPASGWQGGRLYLLTRYEYVNVYHTSVELFSFWLHALVEDLASLHALQVVFTDPHLPGGLDSVWARLTGKEPLRVTDMAQDPQEAPVQCYEDALFSISNKDNGFDTWVGANRRPGASEILTVDALIPLYRDFRQHMRTVYGVTGARLRSPLVQITLIVRRDYAKTARRLHVDRKFANEDELVAALESIEGAEVNVVDMALYSYEEQVEWMSRTDVLVGVHGAGLTQLLYLPDGSSLLEVSTNAFSSRTHFQHPCHLLGHTYARYNVHASHWEEIRVPADQLREHVLPMVTALQARLAKKSSQ